MVRGKVSKWVIAGGAVAGAAAVYFLDKKRGKGRRQNFLRGADRMGREIAEAARKAAIDTEHRLSGMIKHAWFSLVSEAPEDEILAEQIRARLGRLVSRPHDIHVLVDHGRVALWGSAPEIEAADLVHAVRGMRGVTEVDNHLELREPAGDQSTNLYQRAKKETSLNLSPSARLLIGTAGATAAMVGVRRKDPLGAALTVAGTGLIVHSVLNKNIHSVLAFSEDSPGFALEKTINVNAPISDIYDFWTNPENYSKVFSHIAGIERLGENLFRWTITGPAGIPLHWEGVITRTIPNTLVEWKSLPGSTVGNFGIARFDPNYDASTRVHIRMFYRPPAGILGRFVAELFGADPRRVLEQDLKSFKHLFERDENLVKELKNSSESELLKIAKT